MKIIWYPSSVMIIDYSKIYGNIVEDCDCEFVSVCLFIMDKISLLLMLSAHIALKVGLIIETCKMQHSSTLQITNVVEST